MYNAPLMAQSAIAKLLESMQGGGMRPTPPFNPEPPQGLLANAPTPEQMLAQQLSQNADRGYLANQGGPPQRSLLDAVQGGPPQAQPTQAPPVAPQQGLLAGAPPAAPAPQPALMAPEPQGRGNLFQPEMDPALAARMAPEDVSRATPSALRSIAGFIFDGQSPREIQRSRAEQIIADRDDATTRTTERARVSQRAEIRSQMGPQPTEPEAVEEWLARGAAMVAAAPVPDPTFAQELRLAVTQTRPRVTQPRANTVLRGVRGEDGKVYTVVRDAAGNEVSRDETTATARQSWRTREAPDAEGYILQENADGQIRRTPFRAPPGAAGQRMVQGMIKRENDLRDTENDIADLDVAIGEVRANPDAFGIRNFIPQTIHQNNPMVTQEDRDRNARSLAALENVIGALRHGRFGAALSAREIERAIDVFSDKKSTASAIREQLNVIRESMVRHELRLEQDLEAQDGAGLADPPDPARFKTVTVNGKTFRIPETN